MDYSRTRLLNLFENNGVFVNLDDLQETLEMDSITYITLVVDAENVFGIEIPEERLVYNEGISFKFMEDLITNIINEGNMR